MAIAQSELDALQSRYKSAVEAWICAIRLEEALASFADHSEANLDHWEAACRQQEAARDRALAAKRGYEDGLRKEYFNF